MTRANLIIGAGGHGKVIADTLRVQDLAILGFLDDNQALIGQQIFDLPILGQPRNWADFQPDGLIVAIGNNDLRRRTVEQLESTGSPPWIALFHPSAVVASAVWVGEGTVAMAGVIINPDTTIGCHAVINTRATVDHDCVIGDFVHLAPGVCLAGGVQVEEGALLGIGSSVIPGCRIGARAVVGAGAAVVSDIPPGVIATGVPAKWNR